MTFKPTPNKPCEYSFNSINWFKCDILFASDEHLIIRTYPVSSPEGKASEELVVEIVNTNNQNTYNLANDYSQLIVFREPVKEINVEDMLMEAWKSRSLDYAYDHIFSKYQLIDVFEFINKNFKLEKK